jgi:hypothetical protein
MNREEVRTNAAYQEAVRMESSLRVPPGRRRLDRSVEGRSRPDLDFDLNLHSDRRIMAEVQAVWTAGGAILVHTEE